MALKSKVGTIGSEAASLVAIHAVNNEELQSIALKAMENSLNNKDIDLQDYALLYDKILVSKTKKQKYGTQGWCNSTTKKWEYFPILDNNIEQLENFRSKAKLPSLTHYVEIMTASYCGVYEEWQ